MLVRFDFTFKNENILRFTDMIIFDLSRLVALGTNKEIKNSNSV